MVEIKRTGETWTLLFDGKPYEIRGAAGDHSMAELKAAGGNSTRTWGAEEIPGKLAEAERLGMTVTGGIWLGHKAHGFDYGDPHQVEEQAAKVKAAVLKSREHPNLLFWALGNEMESGNDTPQLWGEIGALARMVKELDPKHPVMTVVAEISAQKIKNIQTFAPEIDVLGVNSYGGLTSLPKRLKEAGWTKPYVVTEFGPLGPWESGRTEWGAAFEASSTEKAAFYAKNYDAAIAGQRGWCLGSYAFLWGHKQETTPTWFGLFLPSGEAVGALDELVYRWTGKWPANRAPVLTAFRFSASGKRVSRQSELSFAVEAGDPDGDRLAVRYEIRPEVERERPMGQGEKGPETIAGYPKTASGMKAVFEAPKAAGAYRLYVTVVDGKGKAATANAPFYVLDTSSSHLP